MHPPPKGKGRTKRNTTLQGGGKRRRRDEDDDAEPAFERLSDLAYQTGTVDCKEWRKDCFPIKVDSTSICPSQCLFTDKGYGFPKQILTLFYASNTNPWGERMRDLPSHANPTLFFLIGAPGSGKSTLREWAKAYLTRRLGPSVSSLLEGTVRPYSLSDARKKAWTKQIGFEGTVDVDVDKMYLEYIHDTLETVTEKNLRQAIYRLPRYVADQLSDSVLYRGVSSRSHITFEATSLSGSYFADIAKVAKQNRYKVVVLHMNTPAAECVRRVKERERRTGQESAGEEYIRTRWKEGRESVRDFPLSDLKLSLRDPAKTGGKDNALKLKVSAFRA